MECTINSQPHETQVSLTGQFTFGDTQKFRQIIDILNNGEITALSLNFAAVDFIDSAGLGMLLLLRDECVNRDVSITIQSAQGQVKKIFGISKFDQLFNMSA